GVRTAVGGTTSPHQDPGLTSPIATPTLLHAPAGGFSAGPHARPSPTTERRAVCKSGTKQTATRAPVPSNLRAASLGPGARHQIGDRFANWHLTLNAGRQLRRH